MTWIYHCYKYSHLKHLQFLLGSLHYILFLVSWIPEPTPIPTPLPPPNPHHTTYHRNHCGCRHSICSILTLPLWEKKKINDILVFIKLEKIMHKLFRLNLMTWNLQTYGSLLRYHFWVKLNDTVSSVSLPSFLLSQFSSFQNSKPNANTVLKVFWISTSPQPLSPLSPFWYMKKIFPSDTWNIVETINWK